MDIQILEQGRMSQSGKSLIDSIQARSIGGLDLLIRESVQNSLDASLKREPKTRVDMDFITGVFKAREFNAEFEHITERLNGRYPGENYNFIAVKDSNTYGLTGSNDINSDESRLQSLVYHISKKQTEEGSGGSWGLGKTVFFGIGMGLVIFYSRTFENGEYISKLAATLFEDKDGNPLVAEENPRGISFFGKYEDGIEFPTERSVTVPINDESYIRNFLQIFGISPYENEKTGTTIIIPYVLPERLLEEVRPIHDEDADCRDPVWVSSIEAYFKIALQRWDFPRLANPEYQGSWLKACINGDCISREKMHPIFQLYQGLYNVTLNNNQPAKLLDKFEYEKIEITTNRVDGQVAGYVGAALVDVGDLNLTNEYYRNIYSYVGKYDAALGSPVVTFTRNAGMLIRYETENSKWVPRFENSDENKTLIAVFRLASDKKLKDGSSLEEYVRGSEKSDHNNWEDYRQSDVIEKLSGNTGRKLRDAFIAKDDVIELRERSNLSGLFAEILLPERMSSADTSYDKQTDSPRAAGTRRKQKLKSGYKSRLDVETSVLENDLRVIEFYLRSDSLSKTAEIYFEVNSERGSVSCAEWETEFDTRFPLSVISFELSVPSEKNGKSDFHADRFDFSRKVCVFDGHTVIAKKSEKGAVYSMYVQSEKPGFEFKGRLSVKSDIQSTSFEIKHVSPGVLE